PARKSGAISPRMTGFGNAPGVGGRLQSVSRARTGSCAACIWPRFARMKEIVGTSASAVVRDQQHAGPDQPFEILAPAVQSVPLVFVSAHSGREYTPEFVASSRLDLPTLRRSEDSFVDELFQAAPAYGAPLLRAHFPRVFLDPNREPWELDPNIFEDELPAFVNTSSLRVAGGLGTIAWVV